MGSLLPSSIQFMVSGTWNPAPYTPLTANMWPGCLCSGVLASLGLLVLISERVRVYVSSVANVPCRDLYLNFSKPYFFLEKRFNQGLGFRIEG